MDHYHNPRNYGSLDNADVIFEGTTPGCGDVIIIYLIIDKSAKKIKEITYEGQGCTISQATTSILTELVKDQYLDKISKLSSKEIVEQLSQDIVNNRPKCALLGLTTLKLATAKYLNENTF